MKHLASQVPESAWSSGFVSAQAIMDPRDNYQSRRERRVLCYMPKRVCFCTTGILLGLAVVVVSVSLIAVSFSNVDEGQACMQYSTYTGELENEVILEPTNKMVGVHSGFHCYPKTIQEIEFTRGGAGVNRVLGTRTIEGLFISLDIHIECVALRP